MTLNIIKNLFSAKNLPSNINDPAFSVSVAKSEVELAQGYALLHDHYVNENLMAPRTSQLRCDFFSFVPRTSLIVVKYNSVVVGAVSVTADSIYGLPSDQKFLNENNKRRLPGTLLVEASHFAASEELRSHGDAIRLLLKKYIIILTRKIYGSVTLIATQDLTVSNDKFLEKLDQRFIYPTEIVLMSVHLFERFCDFQTWTEMTPDRRQDLTEIYIENFGRDMVVKLFKAYSVDEQQITMQ